MADVPVIEKDKAGDDQRLQVLLLDYEMGREDDRNLLVIQASLFAIALTVLTLFGGLVTKSCALSHAQDCLRAPKPMLALAPFAPLALIIYVQIIGSVGTLRSFYLRSLEREIRKDLGFGRVDIRSYEGLKLSSYSELVVAHYTLARGLRGPRQLITFLFLGILAVFGGLTFVLVTWVPLYLQVFMVGVYGTGAAAILAEARRATLLGRRLFKDAVDQMRRRIGDPLTPYPRAHPSVRRSLPSYLLLPRPDDLVKACFFPALFLVGVSAYPHPSPDWVRFVLVWLVLELLIYQARYQWNDIRGLGQDLAHPTSSLRGRLPAAGGEERSAVMSSLAVMLLRLWAGCVIALSPVAHLGWWLAVLTTVVFGVGSLYEFLRDRRPTKLVARAIVSWAIFVVVGAGYAVRGVAGLATAGVPWQGHEGDYVVIALFLCLLGSTFVLLTWALEACSYCTELAEFENGRVEARTLRTLADRPHLEHLLRAAGVQITPLDKPASEAALARLVEGRNAELARRAECMRWPEAPEDPTLPRSGAERDAARQKVARLGREAGMTEGALRKLLQPRGKCWTPWNAFTVLAGVLAGPAGVALSGTEYLARPVAVLITGFGAAAMCRVSGTHLRIAAAAVVLLILAVLGRTNAVLLVLPWGALAGILVVIRAKDYRGLKLDWTAIPVRRWLMMVVATLLGRELAVRLSSTQAMRQG